MLYTIKRLNRTVDLDDDLVNKYCEYEALRDQPFSIVVRAKYGHCPTEEEVSDVELSELCNSVLLSELKAMALLPKAVSVIEEKYDALCESAQNGECVEYSLINKL